VTPELGNATRGARGGRTRTLARAGQRPYAQFFRDGVEARLVAITADTPPGPRRYALDGIAAALKRTPRAVLVMIKHGTLPPPDCAHGTWSGDLIEPVLARLDAVAGGIDRDREIRRQTPGSAAPKPSRVRAPAMPEPIAIELPAFGLGEIDEIVFELDEPELVHAEEPGELANAEPEEPEEPQRSRSDGTRRAWQTRRGELPPTPRHEAPATQLERQRRWHAARRAALGIVADPAKVAAAQLAWRRRQGLEPKLETRAQQQAADRLARLARNGIVRDPVRIERGHRSWATRRARQAATAGAEHGQA